jgi:hypothetical protein
MNMKGKQLLIVGIAAIFSLAGCKKELDFGEGQVYTVLELNNGCKVKCPKDAYWENKTITARGTYFPPDGYIVYAAKNDEPSFLMLSDVDNHGVVMTVEVNGPTNDAQTRNNILQYMEAHPYQICTITGTGGVEEHPMNFSCEKVLKLMISDTSDIQYQ